MKGSIRHIRALRSSPLRRWLSAVLALAVPLIMAGASAVGSSATASAASSCGTTDVALGRPATASSYESATAYPASAAVDGNAGTRWSSAWSDPQWLQVDLGRTTSICQVVLDWENPANATAYQIQTSNDAGSWTTIYSTTTSTGGTETLNVAGSGRYIRVYGTARASGYGYSLWEFSVYAGSSGGTPPPTNWTPVWTDGFAGGAGGAPSSGNWIEDTGTGYPGGPATWGTGEIETMSNSTGNVALDGNGHLNITARDSGGAWTSGRVESQRDDFAAPAGGRLMITASIQQPDPADGLGYWPAFWTLSAAGRANPNAWPGVGHADIMEDVNGRSQSSETVHCGASSGGPCDEPNGLTSGLATCSGCQTGYHTYSEIIDRTTSDESVTFQLDGQQVWVVHESQVGIGTWQSTYDQGFALVFDLAIGGGYPNTVCGCTSPSAATSSGGTMSIGAVGVYQQTGTAPPPLTVPPTPSGPSVVKVTGSRGNWGLSVNGAPYYVKGVTFGPSSAVAGSYLPDLASMGVNTIRTWGTDSTTEPLLDAASPYGIKVINGFWLSQSDDYLNDTAYRNSTLNSVVQQVNAYKNNPGVLMWDVGNEVLLSLQNTFSGSQLEAERNAYAQYVEQVVRAIHAADPNHPVTSTDAWTGAWPYYQANAPDLDLYAVNSYGAVCNVKQDWINGGYSKPYIVTESGPPGDWEVPNDANGVPQQETDQQNAAGYATAWGCVAGHTGVALGATLFNYGTENDYAGIWFNLVPNGWKRLAYYQVAKLYGGTVQPNTAPVISGLTLGQSTNVPANGQLSLSVAASSLQGNPLRYNVMLGSKYIDGSTTLQWANFTQTSPGTFSVTVPNRIGVWKVYVYVYDGYGNVGVQTASFKVVPPAPAGTDVALDKPTTASSQQTTNYGGCPCLASAATDGNPGTRWASDWSDPQWLEVDLGQTTTIHHIQLVWEAAYGSAYQIQTSNDNATWTTIHSATAGTGGVEDFDVSGSGRYVRLYGTARGTTYGYSLYEFGVYA